MSIGLCILLLGGAAGASYLIFASEPTAQRESATRRSAALVETIIAERGTYRPGLEVLGRVEPARDVVLSPRVSGQVVSMEKALVPGGLVTEGQALLGIDPVDFERMLTVKQSDLLQVQAELDIEKGRQLVAQREFELLGQEIDPSNRSLVLREPQIESLRAKRKAAEAAVAQAQVDLDRTTVRAPFDAQILDRSVDVGAQIAPGDRLARLVGVEEYWVMASVPLKDLRWLVFPVDAQAGSRVQLRHATAWAPGAFREGAVARLIGTVDAQTRLARVLVTVPDPLGRATDGPPLILGTLLQLRIEGRRLEDVVRLDRAYLRQNDTVWVMAGGALEIRPVEVVFQDAKHAFLGGGVDAGEHIVTTSLATVTDGLLLRRADEAVQDGAQSP